MNRIEFLKHVLPPTGRYCVVSIQKGKVLQFFPDSIEEIDTWAELQPALGNDAYMALATFDNDRRLARCALEYKSVYIDLDCGPNTAYETKDEGMVALKAFVDKVKLPKPTVVSSGSGAHVYFTFTEAADYDQWHGVANALKARIIAEGFAIKDIGITTDASRILRLPNTINFKNNTETEVKVLVSGTNATVQQYLNLLGADDNISPVIRLEMGKGNKLNNTTLALMGNTVYDFAILMRKSLKGAGCAHLEYIYTNAEDVSYPHWMAALSIAQHCEDRETAIHSISNRYSEYDPAQTEFKANECSKPQLCSTFNSIMPDLCEGCQFNGRINTPIVLGKDILEAKPKDNLITAVSPELGEIDIEIPTYPPPYFRGPMGGVYIKKALDNVEDEDEKTLVYKRDLYVVGRRTDPDAGEVIHMRFIRPHDGVTDFTAPLNTITAGDKCRDMLSFHGVAANSNQMRAITNYLIAWTDYLADELTGQKADQVRIQYGWHDEHRSFVIGCREFSKNQPVKYSPPSKATEVINPYYTKEGSLAAWTKVANNYALAGNEVRAFGLFLSLGAPMFKFFALGGAIVHLTNASSGVGKSTIQKVANSVWGNPDTTMMVKDDTAASKYQRMGTVNNLILCMDEVTNMRPEAVSDFAFGITNGRGRNRQQAAANAERINNTTWSLPCITSGNNSLHEVLQIDKADPEGERLRVLEIEVVRTDSLSKQETDQIFSVDLLENYGHAGEVMMQYVLDNYEECRADLRKVQLEFDKAAQLTQPDRYYSALCATAIWGGRVANHLGLVDIPVKPVFDRMVKHLKKRADVVEDKVGERSSGFLGTFLLEHIDHQLIINKAPPAIEGMLSCPINVPRGQLIIRREPDAGRVYIVASIIKKWCATKQINYGNMVTDLEASGLMVGLTKVKMSEGTPQDSPAVLALVLDATKIV